MGYPLTDFGKRGTGCRYLWREHALLRRDEEVADLGLAAVGGRKTKHVARMLYAQSVGMAVHSKWARVSGAHPAVVGTLKRAASEKGVPVLAAELDSHPFLLNCRNGVVDLRTGTLMPHDRGYLITKLCDVDYDPDAKCERFLDFVLWTMAQNPEADPSGRALRLLSFLQKAFGYALTDDVGKKSAYSFAAEGFHRRCCKVGEERWVLMSSDYAGICVMVRGESRDGTRSFARGKGSGWAGGGDVGERREEAERIWGD